MVGALFSANNPHAERNKELLQQLIDDMDEANEELLVHRASSGRHLHVQLLDSDISRIDRLLLAGVMQGIITARQMQELLAVANKAAG